MQYSSPTKTRWSSDSERRAPAPRDPVPPAPLVELNGVSLRFISYADKQYSFKRAALDLVLRRESAARSSEFWALRDMTFQIRRGDRVGIVGGNGAGKSTLLRVLAKIYPPSLGQVSIRGTVAPLIEMGAGFNPELSGADNIFFNGALLGFSRSQMLDKADQIHEFTGLREFADMPLKYYSSGMYMRLAFGIATEVNPDVLLVDESLGVGDAAFQERAKARIRTLLDRSQVVVLVSHDLPSLRELCTRGLWIQQGRLVDDGPIDVVIDRYLDSTRTPPLTVVSSGTQVQDRQARHVSATRNDPENHCGLFERGADDR
jgi:ABC-type polysaccharide/polyol phosphate transport system ATPase subunit